MAALSLPAIAGAVWLLAAGPGITAVVVLFVVVLIAALIAIFTPEVLPPKVKRFVAVFAGLLGLLLALVALPNILGRGQADPGATTAPSSAPPPQPSTAQERLAACRKAHSVPNTQPYGEGKHLSCSWPPPDGAEADGFCAIVVEAHLTDRSSSEDDAVFWAFDSEAENVTVEWGIAHSGNDYSWKTLKYRTGQIISVDNSPSALPPELDDVFQNRSPNLLLVGASGGIYPRKVTCG